MPQKSYRDVLLEDPDVRRWYKGLVRNSKTTADERARILGRFCRLTGWTPKRIVEQVREDVRSRPDKNGDTFEDVFDDFIQDQLDKGRVPSYLANYKKTLVSWLKHNGLPLFDLRPLNLGDTRARPTVEGERIPTPEELRRILHRASVRGRAIISFVAFSGVRFEVLGKGDGTDGLCIKDLDDFAVEDGKVVVNRTPAMVKVRAELSKAGHKYLTFLTAEGTEMVRAYLQSRLDGGEDLTPESAVIRCSRGHEFKGKRRGAANYGRQFIVSRNISREVRKALGSEFKARPYVMRSYFDTMLLLAESRMGLPRDYRVFWMGHRGDVEQQYTLRKRHIPDLIDDLRESFARAESFLSSTPEVAVKIQERMEKEVAEREALEARMAQLEERLEALDPGGRFEAARSGVAERSPGEAEEALEVTQGDVRGMAEYMEDIMDDDAKAPAKPGRTATARRKPALIRPGKEGAGGQD